MREVAKRVGLKKFSPSFLADLANLGAGGSVNPPSVWRDEVARKAEADCRPDRNGYYRLPNGNFTQSYSEAAAAAVEQAVKYHTACCDFLQQAELSSVPGNTPLEKGAQLLKLLAAKQGGEPGGDGEILPIFQDQAGDSVAREVNEVLEEVESLDKEEKELLDPEKKPADSAGSGSSESLSKMKIAEDMLSDKGKREMLKIARQLDKLSRMRVQRENKLQVDPEGDDVRNRPIRSLGELSKVVKPAWATYQKSRTLFWYQAVSGQLSVRERGIRVERKQLLYVIIDCSGSMEDGQRVAKACGVLMNRLKAVMKGDAVLYYRFFDTKLYEERFVSNAAEAKAAMEHVSNANFSGGGTAIDFCSRAALERIDEIMREGGTHRPELVVVTDGDDSVRQKPDDLRGTRLHAFVVEKTNANLTDLAVKSGGVGIGNL
jgi:Mg-chelatase subunit ChlD